MFMRHRLVLPGLLILMVMMVSSCGKDKTGYWDQNQQNEVDRQLIEDYALKNNLNGQFSNSGLYYVIIEQGGMGKPVPSSKITVGYKGYYLDGVALDQGTLTDFYLSNLIVGWQEGIQYIGKGGEIKLILPSSLAYGHTPPSGVRTDAVLVFDINLIDFTN